MQLSSPIAVSYISDQISLSSCIGSHLAGQARFSMPSFRIPLQLALGPGCSSGPSRTSSH